jgi:hypothetical protein
VNASKRDRWVALGMAVSAISAGFSSFDGLRSLAEATGWGGMAPLFALCLDSYALVAIRVWLAGPTTSARARTFAKWNAIGAVALSLAGNAAWHLIAAGLLAVSWQIVLTVGAVPPVVLGLVTHLAVLRAQVDPARPSIVPVVQPGAQGTPGPSGEVVPSPNLVRTGDVPANMPASQEATPGRGARAEPAISEELLAAARAADATYRATYGRTISRDALRRELQIAGTRATTLLRKLRAEADQASS